MALTFVDQATGTTSATLPSFEVGDLAIVFAFRDGSTTPPTLPAGWTQIGTAGAANTSSERSGWRILQTGDTTTGTWSNATSVVVHIYRPSVGRGIGVGASAANTAASTTVNYPALTLQNGDGSSWVAGFAGHRSTNTALETPPAGMVNRATVVDATDEAAGHDTDGGVASWSSTNVSVGGTSSGWHSRVVEIFDLPAEPLKPQNIGTLNEWASFVGLTRWYAIGEATPDSDTSYLAYTAASGVKEERFRIYNNIPPGAVITAVRAASRAKTITSGGSTYNHGVRLGGAESVTGHLLGSPDTYVTYTTGSLARPGGGSWTPADFNSVEFVIRLNSNENVRVTTVWLEVDYTVSVMASRKTLLGVGV